MFILILFYFILSYFFLFLFFLWGGGGVKKYRKEAEKSWKVSGCLIPILVNNPTNGNCSMLSIGIAGRGNECLICVNYIMHEDIHHSDSPSCWQVHLHCSLSLIMSPTSVFITNSINKHFGYSPLKCQLSLQTAKYDEYYMAKTELYFSHYENLYNLLRSLSYQNSFDH